MALVVVAPVFGAGAVAFIFVLISSLFAYDGPNRHTVYGVLGVLIGIELLFGMDVGVLSVSYSITVLLFMLAGRFITIPAWSAVSGWDIADAVRALVVAGVFYTCISLCAVIVGTMLYGYTDMALRMRSVIGTPSVWFVASGIVITLIVLRRIDHPFRRRILFGT
jgi:hypothetical protein